MPHLRRDTNYQSRTAIYITRGYEGDGTGIKSQYNQVLDMHQQNYTKAIVLGNLKAYRIEEVDQLRPKSTTSRRKQRQQIQTPGR